MTPRSKNLIALLCAAVLTATVAWLIRRSREERLHAIDAVPANAFLVVSLDVDLLRKSPLAGVVLGGPAGSLLGGKNVASTCGFDPIDRMREVVVAVPVEDESGEFGVAIRADVTKDELVDCARKVLEARGVAKDVTFRQTGSFTWVEPEGALAKHYPTLAYREGGPYLIARGAWLGTMVDTAEGKLPSARRESMHLSLRKALGQSSDDAPAFALLATVILPKEMRERIKRDMGKEIAEEPGEASSAALMAGALGVEAAGLAISAGDDAGGEARALVELRCEDEAARAAVARIIEKNRREWSKSDSTMRFLGIGALLDNLTVEERGRDLRVSTHEVARWLQRLLDLRSPRSPLGSSAEPAPRAARPFVTSDETVKPKDAGVDRW
jgi:hypothetical protein